MKTKSTVGRLITHTMRVAAMLMLLIAGTHAVMASDWVLAEDKYSAKSYSDHLYFEVFLADLDYGNTYCQEGTLIATNGSRSFDLLKLKYINQGDDESQTSEVKAQLVLSNAKAYFTNSSTGDELTTSEQSFWLYKWGGDNHYMTAKIDFYYPAVMAGGSWKVYFHFKHSDGNWYDKTLSSSVGTNTTLGLPDFNYKGYKVERTGVDQLSFTVPALPNDIDRKLSDVRMRKATYNVQYTFYGENGDSDMRETRSLGRLYGCAIGAVMVITVEIWPSILTSLFGVSPGLTQDLSYFALRVFCGGVLFAGLNILDCGYFVACGVERASFLIQSLRGALLLLPLTAVGILIGNLRMFWLVFPMAEIGSWLLFRVISRVHARYSVKLLPPERVYRRMVSGSTEDVMSADAEIETFCERRGIAPKRCYTITLAVEEICETIVKNGMKDGAICITLIDDPDGDVRLILRYNDDYFNPFSLYTEKASKEGEFDMNAMGILMIRKQAKDFFYRRYQGLNSLVVKL